MAQGLQWRNTVALQHIRLMWGVGTGLIERDFVFVHYVGCCCSPRSSEYRIRSSFVFSTVNGFRMTGFLAGLGDSVFGLQVLLVMS